MFCTSKERKTCDVEKRGCDGCYYNSDDRQGRLIRNMAKAIVCLGTNEDLTVDKVIEIFDKGSDISDEYVEACRNINKK